MLFSHYYRAGRPALSATPADNGLRPANKASVNRVLQTSVRFRPLVSKLMEMRSLDANVQPRNRVCFLEIFNRPGIFENNFQVRAARHAASSQDQTCRRSWFDQSLQTIPGRLRNF